MKISPPVLWKRARAPSIRKFNSLMWIPLFLLSTAIPSQPVQSKLDYRITNRKYISHLVLERVQGSDRIVLITTHPRHFAYKSFSHSLYYECGNPGPCIQLIQKLDGHLNRGLNLGIRLSGSRILSFEFLQPE